MKCKDVKTGSYECTYNIMLPYKTKFAWEEDSELSHRFVSIDKCLLKEIVDLWEKGIKTTGCCCGHGEKEPFIGVVPEYIEQMKKLGYKVQFNPCRPRDEDTFFPKTQLDYKQAKV